MACHSPLEGFSTIKRLLREWFQAAQAIFGLFSWQIRWKAALFEMFLLQLCLAGWFTVASWTKGAGEDGRRRGDSLFSQCFFFSISFFSRSWFCLRLFLQNYIARIRTVFYFNRIYTCQNKKIHCIYLLIFNFAILRKPYLIAICVFSPSKE